MDSQGRKDSKQGHSWRTKWARQQLTSPVVQHLRADKPGGTTGVGDRPHNPGFQCNEIKPQTLCL